MLGKGISRALAASLALVAAQTPEEQPARGQDPKRFYDERARLAAEQAEQVLSQRPIGDTRPRKVRRAEAAEQKRELKRLRKYMHNVDAIVVKLTELRAGQNITPAEIRREAVYLARLGHTVDTICQEG